MIINDNQWKSKLLTKWEVVRYFCGTSDTSVTSDTSDKSDISDSSDTSNTANSSDARKTSATVTRLSSYDI